MTNVLPQQRTEDEIREWIVNQVAQRLGIEPLAVNVEESLVAHGIDSMQFVVLVGELEDWLGCRLASNPLVDYPSVNALSEFLSRQLHAGKTVIDPSTTEDR
jgi:acyl carrier protein